VDPDLRGHGDSGRPHDPGLYLADDGFGLIGHRGLHDYELGGYSMVGKLVLRLPAMSARSVRSWAGQGVDALDAESDGRAARWSSGLSASGQCPRHRPVGAPESRCRVVIAR